MSYRVGGHAISSHLYPGGADTRLVRQFIISLVLFPSLMGAFSGCISELGVEQEQDEQSLPIHNPLPTEDLGDSQEPESPNPGEEPEAQPEPI